jgi:hypothetical protein
MKYYYLPDLGAHGAYPRPFRRWRCEPWGRAGQNGAEDADWRARRRRNRSGDARHAWAHRQLPMGDGSFHDDERQALSRMVRRRDRALTPSCEVERGALAPRRLVPHVGGIRSAERALGEGPKAAFYVRPAVIDSQIFSRTGSLSRRCPTCSSLPRKAPVRTCPPGSGRGRFVSA